jgi:hypothetical protein
MWPTSVTLAIAAFAVVVLLILMSLWDWAEHDSPRHDLHW